MNRIGSSCWARPLLLGLALASASARADTQCQNPPLTPPEAGTCSVVAGDANRLFKGDVVAPSDLLRNGEVLLDAAGTIVCAACDCSGSEGYSGATRIECAQGLIAPGLIDGRRFLTFEQNNPFQLTSERYEHRHDWRLGQNGHTQLSAPSGATAAVQEYAELRALMAGTTSMVGNGSQAGLVRNLTNTGNQENLGQPVVDFENFPLGDSAGFTSTGGCGYPTLPSPTPVPDFTAAEGIGETARNEFRCLSGQQAGAVDVIAGAAVQQGIGVSAADIQRMRDLDARLVWSPRSNIALYGDTAAVTTFRALGVTVALGSDWTPSGSMNLLRELKCADALDRDYFGLALSARDLIDMATVNGARAAQVDDAIGQLAPGHAGDIAVFNAAAHPGYRAVIDAEPQDVVLVMRQGAPLYGDHVLMSALGLSACDFFDVCGAGKRVCLASEIGLTLTGLQTAAGDVYPPFFCGAPVDEPPCVPARGTSVNGSTVYSGERTEADSDGDGVPNAADDCPTVFNPVRPLDNGVQADQDHDGIGDACDACPQGTGNEPCPLALFLDGFE